MRSRYDFLPVLALEPFTKVLSGAANYAEVQ